MEEGKIFEGQFYRFKKRSDDFVQNDVGEKMDKFLTEEHNIQSQSLERRKAYGKWYLNPASFRKSMNSVKQKE
jgi:hypothetical protein